MPRARRTHSDSTGAPNAWRTAPLFAKLVFLLAVFFTFAGIGVAIDVVNLGHSSLPQFVLSVALTGLFAVCYASAGVILRGKFLKALFPLLLLQFFCMGMLGHFFPDKPHTGPSAADWPSRLRFDGWCIIGCTALGYTGFIASSVSEARRYIKIQTEKIRLETEMAAAREVQRLMVPEELPTIPGYEIECIYRPAAEVGGDFFQLIPLKSGSSLAVIGDVSGKGLSAAMIVSLVVGMLGAVTGYTEEPGEILADLNRRLYGRMHGGFTTCLVVRLDAAGRLIFATAGHPAPYLNGREISSTGSMPIGLIETEYFEQTSMDLQDGDLMVLLTDGIPEARNEDGNLFGFARVESLLHDGASPEIVAEAARQYGQNDDITVIGIARNA